MVRIDGKPAMPEASRRWRPIFGAQRVPSGRRRRETRHASVDEARPMLADLLGCFSEQTGAHFD